MANSDQPNPYRKLRQKRKSRVYVHAECDGATQISGWDFTRLADPLWPTNETYCSDCGKFVALDSVAWADTGETVAAYHKRLMKEMSWAFILAPLVSALLVALPTGLGAMLVGNEKNAVGLAVFVGAIGLIPGSAVHTYYHYTYYRDRD